MYIFQANNKLTGLEGKRNKNLGTSVPYTDRGPMIDNSIIAAYAPGYEHPSGGRRTGIILPWSAGFSVKVSTCQHCINKVLLAKLRCVDDAAGAATKDVEKRLFAVCVFFFSLYKCRVL